MSDRADENWKMFKEAEEGNRMLRHLLEGSRADAAQFKAERDKYKEALMYIADLGWPRDKDIKVLGHATEYARNALGWK